jgi:hypothetical protein
LQAAVVNAAELRRVARVVCQAAAALDGGKPDLAAMRLHCAIDAASAVLVALEDEGGFDAEQLVADRVAARVA